MKLIDEQVQHKTFWEGKIVNKQNNSLWNFPTPMELNAFSIRLCSTVLWSLDNPDVQMIEGELANLGKKRKKIKPNVRRIEKYAACWSSSLDLKKKRLRLKGVPPKRKHHN